MKDLDAIMGERESASAESNETATERTESAERGRDDQGRFAAREQTEEKPAQTTETQEQQTQQKPAEAEGEIKPEAKDEQKPGFVPVQARDAERQKRRAAEQRAADLERRLAVLEQQRAAPVGQPQQTAQEDPLAEFLSNPTAFLEKQLSSHLAPLQQGLSSQQEFISETIAVQTYGQDAIEAAKEAALEAQEAGGPAFDLMISRLKSSRHPFDELVKWHREQGALQKYGADPDAYINAEIERRLAERAPQQQQPPAQTHQQLPSSFAAARNSGPRSGPGTGGPRPVSEILPR